MYNITMNTAPTFPSGVVAGMTRIPAVTMKRYIRTFRPFFSARVAQRQRGRRFTPQDVAKLLLIRRLYQDGKSRDEITQALQGEWIPPGIPSTDTETATLIYAQAHELLKEAQREARRAAFLANQADSMRSHMPSS